MTAAAVLCSVQQRHVSISTQFIFFVLQILPILRFGEAHQEYQLILCVDDEEEGGSDSEGDEDELGPEDREDGDWDDDNNEHGFADFQE